VRWTPQRRRRLLRSVLHSLRLLANHRRRTLLSISGLLIGVATVTVMASVGAGAERRVLERVRAMGTDLLVVSAATAPTIAGRIRQSATLTTLRPGDAVAIGEQARNARAAAPALNWQGLARWEGRNVPVVISATTPAGLGIRNMRPASGRLFDDAEDRELRRVVLLGPTAARNLFGAVDPVGREIRLGSVPVDVIGVLQARGTDPGGTDLDNVVVMPLETGRRRLLNIPYVHAIYVQASSSRHLDALEAEVREVMAARHSVRSGLPEPFLIQNQAVLLRTERGAARAMDKLIVGTAALALVIGGIGILAVMLISVRERVREIGLRRAVGARRDDIRLQFLLESALLATAGGAAGVASGIVVAGLAALIGPWDLVLSWQAAVVGLLCSSLLGLAVGVIPADRAASLLPAEALRAA
jgi:putative ABC transport system permease protein